MDAENFNDGADANPLLVSAIFNAFFTNAPEGIFITDVNGNLLAVNLAYADKIDVSAEAVVGVVPSIISPDLTPDDDNENFYRHILRNIERSGTWKGNVAFRCGNGAIRNEWLTMNTCKNSAGEKIGYVGTIIDTDNNSVSRTLNKHCYDLLTKLPNRLLLQDRLEFMINLARRNNKLMALLLLDIDRFKLINDTFGYEAGDVLLKSIADKLTAQIRDVDTVFRSGDDEFAVILEEIARPEDSAKVAERIIESCSGVQEINSHSIHVSACVGISTFPTDGDDKATLLQCAEAAMHRAREAGFSKYMHYKPSLNTRAIERLSLESDLRAALERRELFILYQPQVEIDSGRIVGTEALLRWKHPKLGIVAPNGFIPIAEETGLILPIGEWVLNCACMEGRKWQRTGNPIIMSVNLSAKQFTQRDLVTVVESALLNSGMPPDLLELEITETMSMRNPDETMRTLVDLKDLGVRVAIDDFGMGYSSLSYLKRFPIDTLKIDRSFLIDIPNSQRDTEIVKAIIAMAQSLNLSVVAEGVEYDIQKKFLQENKCDKIQGYLFSPAVHTYELEKLLLRQMV